MWFTLAQAARAGAEDAGTSLIDVDALAEMVAPAYPGQTIVAAELLSGGFANRNFRVSLSGTDAPVVVRVFVRDPSAAQREASILRLISERVPVPAVLYVSPEGHEPQAYLILSWVGGVPLDELLADASGASGADARGAVRAAGAALARLQAFEFPRSGFFGPKLDIKTPFSSEPGAIVAILDQFLFKDCGEERLGAALTQRLWRFVMDHATTLNSVDGHSMLVHGDFGGPNVLIQTDPGPPRVAAVLDWEYAHAGTPLLDLGSMLRRPGHEQVPWFAEAFERGYRDGGGMLPDNWRQVSHIVDLVKLVAFVRSPSAGEVAIESVRALVESALIEESQ